MARRYNSRPKAEAPEYLKDPNPADVLDQIMKMPGAPGDTYNRYGINLSARNMARLAMQGLFEFGNTLPRWNDHFNRSVIAGERARWIARPKFERELDPDTGKKKDGKFIGTYLVKCWFGVNQTHGDEHHADAGQWRYRIIYEIRCGPVRGCADDDDTNRGERWRC